MPKKVIRRSRLSGGYGRLKWNWRREYNEERPHRLLRNLTRLMDPAVLAWALAQPAGSRAAVLAAAYTGGTTRVTFDGRTVEYRSLDELGRTLAVLRGVEMAAARRRSVTVASFSGDGGR